MLFLATIPVFHLSYLSLLLLHLLFLLRTRIPRRKYSRLLIKQVIASLVPMRCTDSISYVNERLTPSGASAKQVSGPLYQHRDHQFRSASRSFVDDSHNPRPFHQHTRQHATKPQYYLPQDSEHNLDNPNTFVGQLSEKAFIRIVADSLDKRAEYNKDYVNLPTYSEPESVFFSVSRPDIPTRDYIARLVTYTQCSPSAFVVMLIYLDRIAISNSRLHVTPYNMHRLLVTALTLACKVMDDRCFSNVHYAKVGGIPTAREMNRLELQFLAYVKYRLHVTDSIYHEKLRSLDCNQPRIPPLYRGAPPTKLVDPMLSLASPVTPVPTVARSPRSASTSFQSQSSTESARVGSQRIEFLPKRDCFYKSSIQAYTHDAYEATSQNSFCSSKCNWNNTGSKNPQHYTKRPASRSTFPTTSA